MIKAYAIYDKQVDAFTDAPFFAQAHGAAIRGFSDLCNDKNERNLIGKHPEDYVLYYIGDFDQDNGRFTQPDTGALRLLDGLDTINRS